MLMLQGACGLERAKRDEEGQAIREEFYVSKNAGPDLWVVEQYVSGNR
jgi:hypothetical protein